MFTFFQSIILDLVFCDSGETWETRILQTRKQRTSWVGEVSATGKPHRILLSSITSAQWPKWVAWPCLTSRVWGSAILQWTWMERTRINEEQPWCPPQTGSEGSGQLFLKKKKKKGFILNQCKSQLRHTLTFLIMIFWHYLEERALDQ